MRDPWLETSIVFPMILVLICSVWQPIAQNTELAAPLPKDSQRAVLAQRTWQKKSWTSSPEILRLGCVRCMHWKNLSGKRSKLAQRIYGASGVNFSEQAQAKLRQYTEWGYRNLPICVAKTQSSLSDDPKRLGVPTGWTLNVTDALLSAGAGFVVAISGNMMLMPGLPKVSRAALIDADDSGKIIGI